MKRDKETFLLLEKKIVNNDMIHNRTKPIIFFSFMVLKHKNTSEQEKLINVSGNNNNNIIIILVNKAEILTANQLQ